MKGLLKESKNANDKFKFLILFDIFEDKLAPLSVVEKFFNHDKRCRIAALKFHQENFQTAKNPSGLTAKIRLQKAF